MFDLGKVSFALESCFAKYWNIAKLRRYEPDVV